jgi:hypothetical protein
MTELGRRKHSWVRFTGRWQPVTARFTGRRARAARLGSSAHGDLARFPHDGILKGKIVPSTRVDARPVLPGSYYQLARRHYWDLACS